MKKLTLRQAWATFVMLTLMLTMHSCKKTSRADEPDAPNTNTVTPSPVGQPTGEAYVEWIGTEGGIVKSPDGGIEIDIPQGALTQETEIGIEPLTNTSTSGYGKSYRLTPHGTNFKKPVTIRFFYHQHERLISNTQTLQIAYQNDKGIWTCVSGAAFDPVKKALAIETTHFSDWALIGSMVLSPTLTTVGLGEQVNLKALLYVHANVEEFLAPLTKEAPAIGPNDIPIKLDEKYIVRWTLNGPGQLTGKGNEATYTAPSATPANKTATVTLELNVKGIKVLLISTIYLVEEGIQIRIDGGPWKTYAGMASKFRGEDIYSIANLRISNDLPQITFMWPATPGKSSNGQYSWSMIASADKSTAFEYFEPDLKHMYVSVYQVDQDMKDSEGFLSVEEITEGGKKYITGVFAIDQAGYFESTRNDEQLKVSSIIGQFKVQRTW